MKAYNNLSDVQLVGLIARNDNDAVEVLLRRYKDQVYTYIFNIVKEEHLANDIFQETFIKIIVTLKQGRYEDNGRIIYWMLRIAYNLTIDYHRKNSASRVVSNDDYQEVDLFNTIPVYDDIEDAYIREQLFDDVEKIVESLPEEQRRIVIMRYYNDMSFKEIAEIEDISINTALGRMRYAIINMRKRVEKIGLRVE